MRRFYAPPENFDNSTVTLSREETRHLRDVLRMRAGEKVCVFDGTGGEFVCLIETIEKNACRLQIIETIDVSEFDSPLELIVGVALLKGEKFDLVVQKCCELGVSEIFPLVTKRADAKIRDDSDAQKKLERWRKIALEAAKQCGRARLPKINAPVSLETFFGQIGNCPAFFFSEREGEKFSQTIGASENYSKIAAVSGAEGGWDDSEIDAAKRRENCRIITFGGRILRAETAAIAVSALLQNHFGDLN